jgi:transcriptional regulator with XRE-family HTH domain
MLKIAKYLKQIRLDNEETLKDMARSLDVTPTFISAIEKGRKKMPVRIRNRIIDMLIFVLA